MALSTQERKALGAYYTSAEIAASLVRWAVRRRKDTVLDPSFGGGVFLSEAQRRLRLDLGAGSHAAQSIFGVDLSPEPDAHAHLTGQGIPAHHLHVGNFFRMRPDRRIPQVDAVVGNPPYIRYHAFSGAMRDSGLAAAARVGVKLSSLCSSWAPFLVHAIGFVRDGGRLAMVLPGELLHSQYSRSVLRFVCESFQGVTAITVRQRLFGRETLEESVLLLAENKGGRCTSLSMVEAESLEQVQDICTGSLLPSRHIAQEEWSLDGCWLRHLVPMEVLAAYDRLDSSRQVVRLGDVAAVDVGVVTGCNDYFMLTDEEARYWKIPSENRIPAVGRATHLSGLKFTSEDFAALSSQKKWMLCLKDAVPDAVAEYICHGRQRQVHTAYKCRIRPTWYSIPRPYAPDAFLTYMTNVSPKLVSNPVGATSTNTLHRVVLTNQPMLPLLQLGFMTTLTQLSAELVGRSYGGGVLKLEPSEAERIAVPLPSNLTSEASIRAHKEVDCCVRGRDWSGATNVADKIVLEKGLGLPKAEIEMLRDALQVLRARRMHRAKRPAGSVV